MPLTEFDIIERFFNRGGGHRADVALGVGDDGAVTSVPTGMDLVTVADMLVAGVHFPASISAADIGHRALAVNLSDLAAMGAQPAWATLALSLPEADETWLREFSSGFFALADQFGVALIGGDTVRGPLVMAVQLHGFVPAGQALRRAGASAGERIFVTGVPGEAAAGLAMLSGDRIAGQASERLVDRFCKPFPRIEQGLSLRGLATAVIDVSDGVAVDLERLATASGLGACIDADSLPASAAMAECFDPRQRRRFALSGGDDYELLFTVPPQRLDELTEAAGEWDCRVTEIGETRDEAGLLVLADGEPLALDGRGYDHFRAS